VWLLGVKFLIDSAFFVTDESNRSNSKAWQNCALHNSLQMPTGIKGNLKITLPNITSVAVFLYIISMRLCERKTTLYSYSMKVFIKILQGP